MNWLAGTADRIQFWGNLSRALASDAWRMRNTEYIHSLRDRERAAKAAIDRTFELNGFTIEPVEFTRRHDGVPYPTTVAYKEGRRWPERCLVIGHGFTAGYESLESLSDLDDFSILLHNRPGVDAAAAPAFVESATGFDAGRHFREQMDGQRQAVAVAVERGARSVLIGGHSMSGAVSLSNAFELRKWEPELAARIDGTIIIQAPASENVFRDSPIGRVPGIERLVHLLGAVADSPNVGERWHQATRFLPRHLSPLRQFTPEQITRGLASTLVVDQMLGDVDGDAYGASKWRAKHTPWKILLADLRSMTAMPPRLSNDHLIGMPHLVIEGTRDRLVGMGTGQRVAALLGGEVGGQEHVAYRCFEAGHYAMVSNRAEVNEAIYRFAATAGTT